MPSDSSLGDRIYELRKEKDISQQKLADAIGVHQSTIGSYEANRIMPPPANILKLADYFGVSFEYLIGEKDYEKSTLTDLDKIYVSIDGNEYSVGYLLHLALDIPFDNREHAIRILKALKENVRIDVTSIIQGITKKA